MKQFASFNWDGFKGSIELLRFLDGITDDMIEAITAVVGNNAFIKGGVITEPIPGTNINITDGIIVYNNKLYSFTGGTHTGTPATLKILFEETTAAGFPQPEFEGDPTPKDIYLARTARIDASGTVFLNTIGRYNKANNGGSVSIQDSYTIASGFTLHSLTQRYGRICDDGMIQILTGVTWTGTKATDIAILNDIPNGWAGASEIHNAYLDNLSTGARTKVVIYRTGTTLKTQDTLPTGNTNLVLRINIIYKKP